MQTTAHNTHHRKLKAEQQKPGHKTGMVFGAPEG